MTTYKVRVYHFMQTGIERILVEFLTYMPEPKAVGNHTLLWKAISGDCHLLNENSFSRIEAEVDDIE